MNSSAWSYRARGTACRRTALGQVAILLLLLGTTGTPQAAERLTEAMRALERNEALQAPEQVLALMRAQPYQCAGPTASGSCVSYTLRTAGNGNDGTGRWHYLLTPAVEAEVASTYQVRGAFFCTDPRQSQVRLHSSKELSAAHADAYVQSVRDRWQDIAGEICTAIVVDVGRYQAVSLMLRGGRLEEEREQVAFLAAAPPLYLDF